jgi:hypothetical protein
MAAAPTVLVMPRWAGGDGLAGRLGAQRAAALGAVLHQRAVMAAEAVSPAAVRVAGPGDPAPAHVEGPGHPSAVRTAGRLATASLPSELAAAVAQAWPDSGARGPLVVLWPDLPGWRPAHLAAALSDLAAGCDLALGPVFDGGFYLLALARPMPGLFELPADTWRSPDAMAMTLALAVKGNVQAGLLRAERALRTSADVAAALADPLLDDELRRLLG